MNRFSVFFDPKTYFSHFLIVICAIVTIISSFYPRFELTYAMHYHGWESGWFVFFSQMFLGAFMHLGILHLLLNGYFLYSFAPVVEVRMSKMQFLMFFITTCVIVTLAVAFFSSPSSYTIGISGFCAALLGYLFMDLWSTKHQATTSIGTAVIFIILIGFVGNISLVGHLSGVLWGICYWFLIKNSRF